MITERFLSIAVACYGDGGSVRELYRRLTTVLAQVTPNYEIIIVNDNSPDDAEEQLAAIAATDSRLTVISHSRNFGSQMAFTSGMRQASGEAVILMDGDLQDPPELIPALVQRWLDGYDVVYGVRIRRKEPPLMEAARKVFYRLLHHMAYVDIPIDAGDFSLLNRRVTNCLLAMPERDRFLRGLRAWVGFRQTGVPYVRAARFSGTSTNSFMENIRWAKRGIFSFSYRPLEIISQLAFGMTMLAGAAIVYNLVMYFCGANPPRGFMTLLVLTLSVGAINLFCLSIVGEYLGRVFEEVKARPQFIVRSLLNDHRSDSSLIGREGPVVLDAERSTSPQAATAPAAERGLS